MDLIWQGLVGALGLLARRDPATLRIAALSLLVSGLATVLAALVGVPLGAALATRRFRGRALAVTIVNTGMGLPPVLVGLGVSILLWRNGPLGPLALIYTPAALVLAQFIVAMPIAAGLTRAALGLLDRDLLGSLRADGATERRVAWELVRAARPQVTVAVAAAFGRAISEVGASLMVGGNIQGRALRDSTRIMTTAISLAVSRGEFERAIALGLVLLALAFLVNAVIARDGRSGAGRA